MQGLIAVVGAAGVLTTALIEAAFLIAIPQAAGVGDKATVSTAFAFTNDVFIRVTSIAPEPVMWLGLAVVVRQARLDSQRLALPAMGLAVAFEVGGLVAIFINLGVSILVLAMFGQAIWAIIAAARIGRVPGA